MLINPEDLAKIQYHGEHGITRSCLNAIIRLIQCGCKIEDVKLLTLENFHCFLLSVEMEKSYIAIKSGFSSGYSGEGPRGLSYALQLLNKQVPWVNEYNISSNFFQHINDSCVLTSDLKEINPENQVFDSQIGEYIYACGYDFSGAIENHKELQDNFPSIVPLKFVDYRISDLALKLKSEPDSSLMTGYRRLEAAIRKRTGFESDTIGARLFTKAFRGDNAPLYWENVEPAEREGRAAMFEGIYMAFRNRRAHRELKLRLEEEVREFILLNELFVLESHAINRLQK